MEAQWIVDMMAVVFENTEHVQSVRRVGTMVLEVTTILPDEYPIIVTVATADGTPAKET